MTLSTQVRENWELDMYFEEDETDFFAEFADIKPLKQTHVDIVPLNKDSVGKQLLRQSIEMPGALQRNYLSVEQVEPVDPYDYLSYKQSGVQDGLFKNLRLGKYKIEQVLNVQQYKFEAARSAVFQHILKAYEQGLRTILIKHGLGLHNKPFPAVLKSYVNQWLQQMPQVIAFNTAQRQHGGYAAVYVLLKKNEVQKANNREVHRKA